MADTPQKSVAASRPLSPHLTIYRWPATMATSITHRATGMGLTIGAIVLAWWLFSISNGPPGWESFHAISDTPIGLLILFGLTWVTEYEVECNAYARKRCFARCLIHLIHALMALVHQFEDSLGGRLRAEAHIADTAVGE